MIDRLVRLTPVVASVALLGALAGYNFATRVPSADAEPYHQRIRAEALRIPSHVGDWNGIDEPVISEATQLLHPNVLFDRRYTRATGNESASLLLVQCKDIRDMEGHYPPNCYPAHGYVQEKRFPVGIPYLDLTIPAMEYEFSIDTTQGEVQHLAVIDFMVLPDGHFVPDMDALRNSARFSQRRPFGAAQVQLVLNAGIPAQERLHIFNQLMPVISPILEVIRRSGGVQ